ncbi:MAG: HDIG domain-containing protein [Candidatus Pacearchaeota archaeon]
MKLPINREQAILLLKKYNKIEEISDWNHYIASESIMKELAKKLGEDEEYYAMLGLLHDIDWGLTKNNVKEHLTKAPKILKEAGFDEEFIENVLSHGFGSECADLEDRKRKKKIEYALAASETLTGLIYAYAIMRGNKISDMELSGLKKKFKDKTFAAGCKRDIIRECENLGINLDEFLAIGIEGMKKIKDEIGLS